MTGQRVGYVRISTFDKNPDRQLEGVALDRCFSDRVSGKDTKRPELAALLAFVREGDTVVVHSMDYPARPWMTCARPCRRGSSRGVRIEFVKEGLAFTGEDAPIATLMLSVMGAFAESEWALLRERQREGISLARQRGAYRGCGRVLSGEQAADLKRRVAAGGPKAQVARDLGITRETVYQYLRETV